MMNYVIDCEYSVTDNVTMIIKSVSKEEALSRVKSFAPNARYYTVIREVELYNSIEEYNG